MAQYAKKSSGRGAPAWMTTFADLMSLMLTFFVLLLSFSELDLKKYKEIAGSMEKAFGVQREIEVKKIPVGTSIVARDFSPGRPTPTPIPEIRQHTTDSNRQTLRFTQTVLLEEILKEEIEEGYIDVEVQEGRTIVRVREKGSFALGSADLDPDFIPVLHRLGEALANTPGEVVIAGHTDNLPISTLRFRSNWDLSAARAVSVAHELLRSGKLPPQRITVEGHADSCPVAPNDTPENRAKNRRVEIILVLSENTAGGPWAGGWPCLEETEDCSSGGGG